MRKLVIDDPQWAAYAHEFATKLGSGWKVVATKGDSEKLERELTEADALLALALPPALRLAARRLKVFLYPGAGLAQTRPEDYPDGCIVSTVYEHGTPIAEYVMMVVLMHVTQILSHLASFREGRWDGSGRMGGAPHDEAAGKTIGLIGYGCIGQAVAERAIAFGMEVLAISNDPFPATAVRPHFLGKPADLAYVLKQSDFLVVACPLTSQTAGMLGAEQLAMLKPSAYLINVSRAEIVDERALFEALQDRRIAGAALDVWYRYPASAGEVFHGSTLPFHELPNVLATPHLAAWTHPMIQRRIARMAENLRRYDRGEPLEHVALVGAWKPEGAAT